MTQWKSALFLATSLAGLGVAGLPAAAEAPSPAQMAQADTGKGLEEIVVTARKRTEASQKIPLAITALSADNIKQQQVRSVEDLKAIVPGFTSATGGAEVFDGLYSLRGVTTLNVTENQDPTVGVYVDGIYQGYSGSNLHQYDLQRIEVVKGPQGTLFGRNTTGGAIQIIHNLPTDKFEGWVKVGVGNHAEHEGAGMINIPIAPGKASLRLVGGYLEHDGFGKDSFTGRQINDLRQGNLYATLKLNPTDRLEIIARGSWDDGRSTGAGAVPSYLVFGGGGNVEVAAEQGTISPAEILAYDMGCVFAFTPAGCNAAVGAIAPQLAAARAAYLSQPPGGNYQNPSYNIPTADHAYKTTGSLTISYELSDNLSLKSITGLVRAKRYFLSDLDGTTFDVFHSIQEARETQLTEELQLIGTAFDSRLHYQTGIFYFNKDDKDYQTGFALPVIFGPAGTSNFFNRGHVESLSAFGEATYALTRQINLTGGLRYSTEAKDLLQEADNLGAGLHAGDFAKDQFHSLSYRAQIDYTPIQDLMFYLKTSKGYRSGGLQGTAPASAGPFKQEGLTDYEAGIKSQFFQNRLRLNVDVYHEDYDNLQQVIFTVVGSSAVNVVLNAEKAKVDGAELEIQAVPIRNLTLGFQGAYTYPHYKLFFDPAIGANINPPFANNQRYVYTAMADYVVPTDDGDLRFHVDWHWQSKTRYNPLPTSAPEGQGTTFQKGYGLLASRISYNLDKYNLELAVWGRNLLDQKYNTFLFDFASSIFGTDAAMSAAEPQSYGFEATLHF